MERPAGQEPAGQPPAGSADTPALVITGASGFVGRHLLAELKDDYRIFALARRSQHDCGAPVHPNIAWMRVDLCDREGLARTFREIDSAGGAAAVIHLAAYYDFTGEDHPEYRRTNVTGTENLLDLLAGARVGRLYFASSVAACRFPRPEGPVGEDTPPDGEHVYAWSKREGERLVRERAALVPSAIVRFGAIYSDWCEYPPLYSFLSSWLSSSWRARILAGRGLMGIPYIHVRDLMGFFRKLLACPHPLEPAEVLLASTAGETPLVRIFELATHAYFGAARNPLFAPRPLAGLGLVAMDRLGRLIGRRPFERPWMRHYVDRRLRVDNSRTCARIEWSPSGRYQLERRLPFMIERLKSEPLEWQARNMAVLRRGTLRPDLRIYHALLEGEDQLVGLATRALQREGRGGLAALPPGELSWFVRLVYRLLLNSVQTSNRMLLLNYLEVTALRRFASGWSGEDLSLLLRLLGQTILDRLSGRDDLRDFRQELHDRIAVPLELGIDEVREQHERFLAAPPGGPAEAEPRERSARAALEETIWQCLVQRR